MIIACPNCTTHFQLDAARLGPEGRQVRCSRCRHEWFQGPGEDSADEHPAREEGAQRALPPPEEQMPRFHSAAEPEFRAPRRAEGPTRPMRPERPMRPPRNRAVLGWAALGLFLAIVFGSLFVAREAVMASWPATTRAYGALGLAAPAPGEGLAILEVKTAPSEDGSTPVLIVTGMVRNTAGSVREVPMLKAELRDAKGKALHQWLFEPPKRSLGAGETADFETRAENPPGNAVGLAITFAVEGTKP